MVKWSEEKQSDHLTIYQFYLQALYVWSIPRKLFRNKTGVVGVI
jgi:hypothetical protein